MAFVSKLTKSTTTGNSQRHSECACEWRLSHRDGVLVVQLDSYGSEVRKFRGKLSQTLQFDREQALALIEVLGRAFPGIVGDAQTRG